MIDYFNSPGPKKQVKVQNPFSPSGIADFDSVQGLDGFPEVPFFEGEESVERSAVLFSGECEVVQSDWEEIDLLDFRKDVWWTGEDITAFRQAARSIAQKSRTNPGHAEYIKALATFFQMSQKGKGREASQQEVLWLAPSGIRGLEATLHPVFGKNHRTHALNLLKVQNSLKKQAASEDVLQRTLKLSSRQTSRPSQALAQVLALGDHLQVVATISTKHDAS